MIVAQTCKRAFQRRETVRVHGLEVGPVMKPDRTNDRADPEHVLFLLRLFLDVSHARMQQAGQATVVPIWHSGLPAQAWHAKAC